MSESFAVVQATNKLSGAQSAPDLQAGVTGPLSAVGGILFGASGPVVLGAMAFDGFEVPASITWGGRQRVTVHKFPGGARVMDAMGPDDRDLSWSGTFLGFDAVDRAFQVDAIRQSGAVVPLVWANFFYRVMVTSFEADHRHIGHTPYRVTCEVLVNASQAPPPNTMGAVLAVGMDLNAAAGYGGPASVLSAVSAAQGALALSGLSPGSTSYASAVTATSGAQSAIASAQSAADAAMLAATVGASTGIVPSAGGLLSALSAASTGARMAAALPYAARAAINAATGAV